MNIIPIPVKRANSADQPRYEVLANHHIFFALKKAQCPLARCLSLNRPEEQPEIWQAELQVEPAKLNVASINQEELHEAFAYLAKREKGLAKLLSHGELIQALANHPSRPYWSSWDPIKALAKSHKVTITKKHTNRLDTYFSFAPQSLPRLCINTVSAEELSRHLHILPLEIGVVDQLSHQLSGSPSRPYWRDFKDVSKALRDETQFIMLKATQTILAQGFHFTPAPPPVPNTVPFLLRQMTVRALRQEADERGLVHKGMKEKADLVRLLSSG
ncbi:MAG: hypothetical protein F4Z73_06040 [Synechococcus sp. SB0668_bin_13]|nr:hypothetical protein [Synechococcus sp. SB0668_bin_13]